jgi:hypothetical protein
VYLAEHYNGGRILATAPTTSLHQLGTTAGIDYANVIYEGSGDFWDRALLNPGEMVDWVYLNVRRPEDLIARSINVNMPEFHSQFDLVLAQEDGQTLFRRKGVETKPTDAAVTYVSGSAACGG